MPRKGASTRPEPESDGRVCTSCQKDRQLAGIPIRKKTSLSSPIRKDLRTTYTPGTAGDGPARPGQPGGRGPGPAARRRGRARVPQRPGSPGPGSVRRGPVRRGGGQLPGDRRGEPVRRLRELRARPRPGQEREPRGCGRVPRSPRPCGPTIPTTPRRCARYGPRCRPGRRPRGAPNDRGPDDGDAAPARQPGTSRHRLRRRAARPGRRCLPGRYGHPLAQRKRCARPTRPECAWRT